MSSSQQWALDWVWLPVPAFSSLVTLGQLFDLSMTSFICTMRMIIETIPIHSLHGFVWGLSELRCKTPRKQLEQYYTNVHSKYYVVIAWLDTDCNSEWKMRSRYCIVPWVPGQWYCAEILLLGISSSLGIWTKKAITSLGESGHVLFELLYN